MAQKNKAKTASAVKSKIQVGSGTLQKSKSKRGFSINQLNQRFVLIVFAALFGLVGVYMLLRSRAGVIPDGSIFAGSFIVDAGGVETTPQRYPSNIENSPTGLRDAAPTMSLDGRKIAYYDSERGKIRIIETKSVQQVSEFIPSVNRGIQRVAYMQWSQNNNQLVVQYETAGGVMKGFVITQGEADVKNLPDAWNIAVAGWTPDNRSIVYIKDYKQLCTFTVDNSSNVCSAIQNYTDYTANGGTVRARIAPNGSTIAAIYKKTTANGTETRLYTMTLDGKTMNEVRLMENQRDITAIAWSPMSDKIAYAAQDTTTGEGSGLMILDLASKQETTLVPGGGATTIPQLDWVIREVDQEEASSPLQPTAPKVTVGVKPVALSSIVAGAKTVSPIITVDSGIVYMPKLTNATDPAKLRFVNRDGSGERDYVVLPDPQAVWSFDGASQDGKLLAFHKVLALSATQVIQENWISDSNGGKLRMVSRQVIGSNEEGYSLSWKADSTGFIYMVPAFTGKSAQLCSQDAVGTAKQCVDVNEDLINKADKLYYDIAKDGTSFVVVAQDTKSNQARLFKVDVSTGAATLLKHLPNTKISALSWSPDGVQFGVVMNGQAGTGVFTFSPDAATMTQVSGTAEPFVWLGN